jgi:uncharacterized protein (TIGR03083 family)
MPTTAEPDLGHYVDAWEQSLRSTLDLADGFDPADWQRPTRCPGWDVHDQVAHLVAVEAQLGGAPVPPEAPAAEHVRNSVGQFVERGVHARRGVPGPLLLAELREVLDRRLAELRARPLTPADELIGVMGKPRPAQMVLRARAFDVWAHEQDIRAAVTRPGNLDAPAADVAWEAIVEALAGVILPAADASAGQSVAVEVTDHPTRRVAVAMDAEGNGQALPAIPDAPTVTLSMSWADLVARTTGRLGAQTTPVAVDGDAELGRRILFALAMTP